ncbi:MAG TPA: helix-turn-helix transcriptional regulator [Candidatus Limnocylindrales bacterium]
MTLDDDRAPAQNWNGRRAFGRAIRRARRSKGLTQFELGSRSRLSQAAISRIETGDVKGLRYQTLMRILDALEVREIELTVARRQWFGVAWTAPEELAGGLQSAYDREGHRVDGVVTDQEAGSRSA